MKSILTYSKPELFNLMNELAQPSFRSTQLYQWLYCHGVSSYDEMTNLPAKLRMELSLEHPLVVPTIEEVATSSDGTRKYLIRLQDGALVETVGMPSRIEHESGFKRLTVCFSTQVGCPMACSFCATGKEGFTRNLTPGEMVWQILLVGKDFDLRVSNVVAMGQGEPFLNYDNLMAALRIMNDAEALNIGARHISVSTCGIAKGLARWAEEPEQFTLAVSLHSARQDVRNKMMPKCAETTLKELHALLQAYCQNTNRRITFEYLLVDGLTDTDEDVAQLIEYCRDLTVHVNILPVNDVEESPYRPTGAKRRARFIRALQQAGIEATLRDSRGSDIGGACGQLKNARASH